MPLPRTFYLRRPAVVARDLLGCVLVSRHGRTETAGRIVETEAYLGPEDGASHAAFRPGSHALLYGEGGHAYVFMAYGVHMCFNATTGAAGTLGLRADPGARAATGGREHGPQAGGRSRRRTAGLGSGNLTRALGITLRDNGVDLTAGALDHRAAGPSPASSASPTGPRIGITKAVERPLRFWVAGNRFVSGAGQAGRRATQTPG